MHSFDHDGKSYEIADKNTPLKKDATNRAERKMTLSWAINTVWASKDVGALERWDRDGFHGWVMWSWKAPSR